jgi:reactive chlorine resistance protein C
MSSSSIAITSVRTVVEPITIEDLGREIVRSGLAIVLAWIGAMKFTAFEAMGIQPWSRTALHQLDV